MFGSSSNAMKASYLADVRKLFLVALGLILFLSLCSYDPVDPSWSTWSSKNHFENWMGRGGSIIADILFQLFGLASFTLSFLPVFLAFAQPHRGKEEYGKRWWGPVFFLVSLSVLFQTTLNSRWMPWHLQNPGGMTGEFVYQGLLYVCGKWGAILISFIFVLASAIVAFKWNALSQTSALLRRSLQGLVQLLVHFPQTVKLSVQWANLKACKSKLLRPIEHKKFDPAENFASETDVTEGVQPVFSEPLMVKKHKSVSARAKDFSLPALTLLSGKADTKLKTVDKNWYLEKANILVQKLKDFGVEGEVVHISPGPVITVYEFKPASGVKIKEISNLSDDLTLALSVLSVRIVAPIPGKPVVGIEIPSPHREMVFFKDLIQETPFFSEEFKIPIVLGRLASGEPVTSDLASMPHLLIAGTTGTGKSVFINTLICSLLYRFSPKMLKLLLVDPKMVELSHYEGIPHLLLPVVVDSRKAVLALRWAVDEMERRYTLMHQSGVRHIDAYNERFPGETHLPYIVVVIDEYADLMAVVPKEVELSIARLAQKARASGIHLVLATQRPSTDVVTGTIKANFPSRISFRVASSVDSKTILDRAGSERLLGHGDMLFHSAGFTTLRRMQGPYLSDTEIEQVVEYLKAQGEPEYDERILKAQEADLEEPPKEEAGDENLYEEALQLVREKGEASISLIQRHLRIGYNRAASLMEELEKKGVVGESTGPAKRRVVLLG